VIRVRHEIRQRFQVFGLRAPCDVAALSYATSRIDTFKGCYAAAKVPEREAGLTVGVP